jgi:hypothetical protein
VMAGYKYTRLKIHAYIQSVIFFVCGLWPVFSIQSFMYITGRKTDIWLVKSVGLLLAGVAVSLFTAAKNDSINLPVAQIGVLSALAILIIDLVYVFNHTISKVYLLDALLQSILILGWLLLYKKKDQP